MRKSFEAKPWVFPQPVLIIGTYDENGKADAMNAAWGGQYGADKIMLCLSPHKTTENMKKTGAFTVSFADREHMIQADYVGIVSGNQEPDKLAKAGWHTTRSGKVNAPLIDELPFALECRFLKVNEDGVVVGQIVGASADERILGENGMPDPGKFHAIVFDPVNAAYIALGDPIGKAFSDGAKVE